jgi:diguanylate cyclase (GGDEF)-like protein
VSALGAAARVVEAVVVAAAALVLLRSRRAPASVLTSARTDDAEKPGETSRTEARGVEIQSRILGRVLSDLREVLGAEEAVLWRWTPRRDALVRAAVSPASAVPTVDGDDLLPLVAWAAEQRMPHVGSGDDGFALAPVEVGGVVLGAIGIRRSGGFDADRERVRKWLPRSAAHLGQLSALLDARDEFARASAQREVLLDAATAFQRDRSIESLGTSICETAVRVTGARDAALIRWFSDREDGTVQSVSPADGRLIGQPITLSSHVARVCASGLPEVWEDATRLDDSTPIFGLGEPVRAFGSLAIVALKGERGVTGALAIFGERPGDVRNLDVRNVRLLAAMAAVSLETLWEIEDVTRRARTDQLTGLPNRRAFDDALGPALIQAERYEQPLSLIMADIDHFKRVNDTLGHAAGDAVLKAVASTVQRLVRTSDLCARFGGEEIAVLLPHTPQRGAEELAERLRAAVAGRPVRTGGKDVDVTVSFGVASLHESVAAGENLFVAADRALYDAKAAGRNRVKSAPKTR